MQVILQGKNVYLRDPLATDIEDFKQWYQPNQEWLEWDAPWETFQEYNFDVLRANIMYQIANKHNGLMRNRFEICTNGHDHIGWVSWYYINKNNNHLAIGIDIIDQKNRSKGYGLEAYVLFIRYLLSCKVPSIYTQTWSGNERMMRLARKCCFVEVERLVNYRLVRGIYYDQITYQLDIACFFHRFP